VSGVAVVLHGHVRPVADLDIVIDPDPIESQRALEVLALAGFTPSILVPMNMVSVFRMFDQDEREVDVFVRFQLPFSDLWEDSQLAQVGRTVARIPSLEKVIRAKQLRGRPDDLEDIEGLKRANESKEAKVDPKLKSGS
jgi:hypothetical protein